jgi:osmotically-inducible protein OsmY
MKKSFLFWLALAAFIPSLTGCFPAAVVGVSAGALVASDRRLTESYLSDEAIKTRASSRIDQYFGDATHVNVTSYNRNVLLSGECLSEEDKARIGKLVAEVPNVRVVYNQLVVAQASSLGERTNDAYITSKTKARFVDSSDFSARHVKVVTERGTVFLLGLVTQQEADAAVEIARTTGGVQGVVRLFEILTPEEVSRLDVTNNQNPPPNSAP